MDIRPAVADIVERFGGFNKASRKLDIPTGTLFSLAKGINRDPRISTIEKLAKADSLSVSEFFNRIEKGFAA